MNAANLDIRNNHIFFFNYNSIVIQQYRGVFYKLKIINVYSLDFYGFLVYWRYLGMYNYCKSSNSLAICSHRLLLLCNCSQYSINTATQDADRKKCNHYDFCISTNLLPHKLNWLTKVSHNNNWLNSIAFKKYLIFIFF